MERGNRQVYMDGRPVPPALPGGYSPKPLTGFMWIGVYYIPRHDVSAEKVNAVDLGGMGIYKGDKSTSSPK